MLQLVHRVDEDLVADEGQAADDVEDAVEVRDREANVLAVDVEAGEAAEAAEDDGAALEGGEEVLVDEAAEAFEAGDDGLVPAFVALHSSSVYVCSGERERESKSFGLPFLLGCRRATRVRQGKHGQSLQCGIGQKQCPWDPFPFPRGRPVRYG